MPAAVPSRACGGLATGIVLTTVSVAGSMRVNVPSAPFATQTPPGTVAIAIGPRPTGTTSLAYAWVGDCGAIFVTVALSRFATQIASFPAAMATGSTPTWTVSSTLPDLGSSDTTVPVDGDTTQTRWKAKTTPVAPGTAASVRGGFLLVGSISETVPSTELATQTRSAPYAMPIGPLPTWIVCAGRGDAGSMRETVPSSPFATQTEPWPTATPTGPPPTWYVWLGASEPALIRATVLASGFVTQVAPSPTATPPGDAPAEKVDATSPLVGLITPTESGATEALAVEPFPCVRSTPATTPITAAPNVAAMSVRVRAAASARQLLHRRLGQLVLTALERSRGGTSSSGGNVSSRPGATSW